MFLAYLIPFIPLIIVIPFILWISINESMESDRLQVISTKLDKLINKCGLRSTISFGASAVFRSVDKSRLISQIDKKIDLLLANFDSTSGVHFPFRNSTDVDRKYKQIDRKLDILLSLTGTNISISARVKNPIFLISHIRNLDTIIEKVDLLSQQLPR